MVLVVPHDMVCVVGSQPLIHSSSFPQIELRVQISAVPFRHKAVSHGSKAPNHSKRLTHVLKLIWNDIGEITLYINNVSLICLVLVV